MSGILFWLPSALWPAAELFLFMVGRLGRSRKTGGVPCRVAARWQSWGRRGRAQQFGTGAESGGAILPFRFASVEAANPSHHRAPSPLGWGAGRTAQSSGGRWQRRRLLGAENCLPASLQERALEVKLKVSGRANALGKQTPQ